MFDESTKLCNVKYKTVFLGASAVGKSAIIQRFVQQRFDPNKMQTVGIDFFVKNVTYKGSAYKMQLWDTAGQQKFRSLVPNYLRDAHCAVFVYDISRPQTLAAIDSWVELFKNLKNDNVVKVLVGNKAEAGVQRRVSKEEGENKAKKLEMSHCQTSAMLGEGIESLFHSIIRNINVMAVSQNEEERTEHSRTETSLNKKKLVKIAKNDKQFSCCYI